MVGKTEVSALPKLSPEEENSPYSEFYYQGAQEPPEEIMQYIDIKKPMAPELAVYPDNVDVMLDPGYLEREAGWCILPDGIGYSASHIKMPDVSVEANNWWGPWHEQKDVRYKCWCPGVHFKVGPRWSQEDVGLGNENIFFMQRLNPEIIGFDTERVKNDPSIVIIRGQNMYCIPAESKSDQRPLAAVVMHMIRRLSEGGVEYRSRFWTGLWFLDGKPVRMIPEDERVSEERAFGWAYHCAHEMATLGRVLPKLYARFGNCS